MPVHIKVILHSHEIFTILPFLESAEGYENHLIYFPDGGIIKWSTSAQHFTRSRGEIKSSNLLFSIPISPIHSLLHMAAAICNGDDDVDKNICLIVVDLKCREKHT
jgi:hypothetical protein